LSGMVFTHGMTKNTSPAKINRQIDAAFRAIAGYEAMIAVAEQYQLEYEIERLTRNLDEMHSEIDYLINLAISLGYEPDNNGSYRRVA